MAFINKNYGSPVNEERLYELESALLEQEGYDLELAGARILGGCRINSWKRVIGNYSTIIG